MNFLDSFLSCPYLVPTALLGYFLDFAALSKCHRKKICKTACERDHESTSIIENVEGCKQFISFFHLSGFRRIAVYDKHNKCGLALSLTK